ncbi:hypothetical protein K2X05_14940 [bacterium]|nr:hypothetical protein [bacterium]
MKKVFLIILLVGFSGSVAFARLNTADPNLHPNGARGASMSDFVMMAAEVVALGAGLGGASDQPFQTSSVQNPSDGNNLSLTDVPKKDDSSESSDTDGVEL